MTDQFEGFDEMEEVKRQDWGDVADVPVDPGKWRDGGPTNSGGHLTTTGGTGGNARRPRPAPPPGRNVSPGRRGPTTATGKIAPTTTGDATTGGMETPQGGSTSDASTGAESTTYGGSGRRDR